jgi:transposase
MIQITPQMRILVAVEPVDFRKGSDGRAALCRQVLASDPLGGTLFVFCSRRRHAIKFLTHDGQGFWLCQKRLSQGPFQHWPQADAATPRAASAWIRISCTCCCGTAIPPRPGPLRSGGR